jgi:NAD(P)-dependent dehydrogenase (short-subunit alcohol dehydrogenase family)
VADSADVWRQILNVNVVAASLCTQLAINLMIEKGVYFIFILKLQTQSNGFSCI